MEEGGYVYGTAWPLSEKYYLCVYTPGGRDKLGIYLLDAFGNKELLYRDPEINCIHPIPLRPQIKPPVIPHMTAVGKPVDRQPVRTTPGEFGARASKLYQLLKKGHHDLKMPPADMHRIVLWLDLNSNFYGDYNRIAEQSRGERVMPELE